MNRAELNARWASIYADRARIFLDVLGERALPAHEIHAAIRARGAWWTREQFRQTFSTLRDEGKIERAARDLTGSARNNRYRKVETK